MDYTADELPLPSFVEVFGDGALSNPIRKKKKSSSGKIEVNGEESTGRWTPDEHRLFLEGIMLYGKDWKKMQPLIKTRSLVQIRTHAQKVFKKIGLKKIAGVMKRRGVSIKEGEVEPELEDVLEEELEHLGMMEGVDDVMLANLAAQSHHAHQQHLMHGGVLAPQMNLGHSHPHHQQHMNVITNPNGYIVRSGPGLHIDVNAGHMGGEIGGLPVSTPMMSHTDTVFDTLHDTSKQL